MPSKNIKSEYFCYEVVSPHQNKLEFTFFLIIIYFGPAVTIHLYFLLLITYYLKIEVTETKKPRTATSVSFIHLYILSILIISYLPQRILY